MKVGDLVRISSKRYPGMLDACRRLGLIIAAPHPGSRSYKVWWMAQNKAGWPSTGWWDAIRLEKVE